MKYYKNFKECTLTSFVSKISNQTSEFKKNYSSHLKLIEKMIKLENRAAETSELRRSTFTKRNQLSPRERLAELLDPGMPFLHLYNLANFLVEDKDPNTSVPGASVISGIGYISGVQCVLYIDDSGINAGAITMKSVEKGLACISIAKKFKLPLVHLVESAGVNLTEYSVELWTFAGGSGGRNARRVRL